MEKKVEISMLCQLYGKLLTEKQYEFINDYYNNDLSLSEIAENENITRQAVRDIIKKGEKKLEFMKRMSKQENVIENVLKEIAKIDSKDTDKQISKILEHVRKELNCLV